MYLLIYMGPNFHRKITDKFVFVFILHCEHLLRILINNLRCCRLLMDVDSLYSIIHTLLSLANDAFIKVLPFNSTYYCFQGQVQLFFSTKNIDLFTDSFIFLVTVHCLTSLLNKMLSSPQHSSVRALTWIRSQAAVYGEHHLVLAFDYNHPQALEL